MTKLDAVVAAVFLKLLTLDGREIVYHAKNGDSVKLAVLVDELTPEARDFLKVSAEREALQLTALTASLRLSGSAHLPARGDQLEFKGRRWGLIPGGNRRFYDYEESGGVTVTFYAQAES